MFDKNEQYFLIVSETKVLIYSLRNGEKGEFVNESYIMDQTNEKSQKYRTFNLIFNLLIV